MKLLTLINRRFLLTSMCLLGVCSLFLFFMMRYMIRKDMDENLQDERDEIIYRMQHQHEVPENYFLKSNRIQITRIGTPQVAPGELKDTMIYYPPELEYIPHRQLSFVTNDGNNFYRIAVSHSKLESDDLLLTLLLFTLLFISILLTLLYFFNRRLSKSIWQPFGDTLEKLRSFDVSKNQRISFSTAGIAEFEELNHSLSGMTDRISGDYSKLKQFTENASHEIQTPLAVIRSRLEVLIQSENLSEEQSYSIQKINAAVSKLSKLNTALLTLTKIENRQFAETEDVFLTPLIREKLKDFEEYIREKNITTSVKGNEDIFIRMNPSLSHLLFDNLISNAIRHNSENGHSGKQPFIRVLIDERQFSISNSGEQLSTPREKLFDRFVKNNPSSDSLGLGLAIVKEICRSYNFDIHFNSEDHSHTVTIRF